MPVDRVSPQNQKCRAPALPAVIEQAKNELERMIDLSPQGILLMGGDGFIQRMNAAALRMLGHATFPDALGRSICDVFPWVDPAAAWQAIQAQLHSAEPERRPLDIEADLPGMGRRLLRLSLHAGSDPAAFVAIIDDATETQNLQRQIECAHKTAAVRETVGALLHYVNQPLTVIMIRAQMLLMRCEKARDLDTEFATSLAEIVALTQQISETLKGLTRVESYATEEYVARTRILDVKNSIVPAGTGRPSPHNGGV